MIVSRNSDVEYRTVTSVEGLPVTGSARVKPLLQGDEMTIMQMVYAEGASSPMHSHDHESLLYVISGKVQAIVGDETFTLQPGDVCRHPIGVPHNVQALEQSTFLEVKSPAPSLEQFASTE